MSQDRAVDLRREFPDLAGGLDALFDALGTAATPVQEMTVSEHADRFRKVSAESGSRWPGDWVTARFPYVRQPTDCLHPDHPARSVRCKWSAQTGKSEIGVNWFCFIVDRAPGPMLTMLPSLEEALKYNRVKLQPTIDASPQIRHRVRPENTRDEAASTTAFKRFAGGFDQIVTASSSKGLQMVTIRYLIAEEVSEYEKDVGGRGSPLNQGRARQKRFGDLAKELIVATPGLVGDCLMSELYDDGDRRECYLPCPSCGQYQVLRHDNMQPPSPGTANRVTFACIHAGCIIDQISLPSMLERHRWVPRRVEEGEPPIPEVIAPEDIDGVATLPCEGRARNWQPSFAIWAAYSPAEMWGDIYARGVAAMGDPVKEKPFWQQDLGLAYEIKTDVPDWEKLLAVRTDWPRDTVPYPGAVLTGFIDVQGNRFEWGVYAFGPGFQAWPVGRGIVNDGYESDAAWAQIDALTARRWPTASGRELDVMAWGIDTGAFTQALYDRVAGRHRLQATKGENRPRAVPFKLTRADLRDARGKPIAGRRIDLGFIGNFDLKQSVYDGLRHLVAGPDRATGLYPRGTIHLPVWFGEDELKQITAEVLIDPRMIDTKGKKPTLVKTGDTREWRKRSHQPNEGLDIAVGCRALAWGEGAGEVDAARWDELVAEAHKPADPAPDLFTTAPLAAPALPPDPWASALPTSPAPPFAKPKEDIDTMLDRLGRANAELWT